VKSAFKTLLELIPADGTLIYHADDVNIPSLLKHCKAKTQLSYGDKKGDYQIAGREVLEGRNQFSVTKGKDRIADLALKIFGEHNSLNALSAFAMAHALKWPQHKVLQALADFQGVKRRQEILGEVNGITVVEDFAHHPTAVDLTLKCMRERFPKRRVLAVFEPRSATSRRKVFQQDYARAFAQADAVFMAQPFDQSKIVEQDRFSTDELIEELRNKKLHAESAANADGLVEKMGAYARPKDVILIMSNGGFDGIYQKLLSRLK